MSHTLIQSKNYHTKRKGKTQKKTRNEAINEKQIKTKKKGKTSTDLIICRAELIECLQHCNDLTIRILDRHTQHRARHVVCLLIP
jgi:hypothetical protein